MAIHATQNLYPGVNPHWNSLLQQPDGGWESFRTELLVGIRMALKAVLPPGYLAMAEKGLQINQLNIQEHDVKKIRITPDVTIFQADWHQSSAPATTPFATPTYSLALPETISEEALLPSVLIYQLGEGKSPYGKPVTRIELLSPANKPGGSYHHTYQGKRLDSLYAGMRLVEIDFLHETRPILSSLASYPERQPDASPYYILVSDPRPTFERGYTNVYGFGVLDSIPAVAVPLVGADQVVLDCGNVYHQIYESIGAPALVIDYASEPVHFDRYSEPDRTLIRQKMHEIAQQQ